jgi:hypothetical protein
MENQKNPYFDKLVIPNEQIDSEQKFHQYIINKVENIGSKKIENFEINKTDKDIELIHFTEIEADKILNNYGRSKIIQVSLDNIHLLNEGGTEDYTNGRLIGGAHSTIQKSIIVDRVQNDLQFTLILFHELMHLKSYSAMQVLPDNESITTYRSGISVVSRDGKSVYLENIEEAVIGYLTTQFYESLKNDKFSRIEVSQKCNENSISRQPELAQLNYIVNTIFQKNSDAFQNKQQVFDLFINAQVNGNLRSLSRIVKETFGIQNLKKLTYGTIE